MPKAQSSLEPKGATIDQQQRIEWLVAAIAQENGFQKVVTQEVTDLPPDISLTDRLNLLSEIYMSYPTIFI